MTYKQNFLSGFDKDYSKVIVEVIVPNCPETELIINKKANFKGKKEYYEKSYNDNLELISFPEIRIVNFDFQ